MSGEHYVLTWSKSETESDIPLLKRNILKNRGVEFSFWPHILNFLISVRDKMNSFIYLYKPNLAVHLVLRF